LASVEEPILVGVGVVEVYHPLDVDSSAFP
jgi:hypothetical protein